MKAVAWALAALAALLAVDTAAWVWATTRMAQELAAWEAGQLDYGLHIMHGPPERAGWPFAARLVLPQVSAAAEAPGARPGMLSWQADRVTISVSPLAPTVVLIAPSGSQRVTGLAAEPVPVTATRLELLASLSGAPLEISAAGLQVGSPGAGFGAVQGAAQLDPTHFVINLAGVTLPVTNLPFGGSIASVSLRGSTNVAPPSAADIRGAAAAWRDAGGKVVLDHASIHWGPLDAEGSGSGSLDAGLQPVAAAKLRLTGYGELIEAMARAGVISRNDARVAATLLGLMARPGDGGATVVELPLNLQDGRLAVGAIPLARLPRLELP